MKEFDWFILLISSNQVDKQQKAIENRRKEGRRSSKNEQNTKESR